MIRIICAVALGWVAAHANGLFGAEPAFEKVSPHCYCLSSAKGGENVAAVITEEGVLILDPPPAPRLSVALEGLKKVTSKAVRWVVFTCPRSLDDSGAAYLARQGAVFLSSTRLHKLLKPLSDGVAGQLEVPDAASEQGGDAGKPELPWMLFDRRMRLFPSHVEIRIFALQKSARTGEDIVLFLPDEKVLLVGDLFAAARFPDIDNASGGDAIGWIDGLEEVIGSVPLLKPAIPKVKNVPEPKQEKSLEEGVQIVSASGRVCNLQHMKGMLYASQRLRMDIAKAVRSGRTCDDFLASPLSTPYRNFANLDSFARQLFQALSGR